MFQAEKSAILYLYYINFKTYFYERIQFSHSETSQYCNTIRKSEVRLQYSTLKLAQNLKIGRPKTLYSKHLSAPMWPDLEETASIKRRKNE